jgi:hypothetical protein
VLRGKFSLRKPYTAWASAICEGSADVWFEMAKQPRDSIPALVLEVIARVYELAERRTQPWYIDRAALDLGHASDSVDSSIYYAEVSGWLVGADEPPKSVALTADGVRLLEECGFI